MIIKLHLLFSIFIYVSIITAILFIIALCFTKKFKDKYRNIYAIFIDVGLRETIVYATIVLNFLLNIYFLIAISKYDHFAMYMIIFTNIVSSVIALNFRLIINNIVYCFTSIELLWLLKTVNNYFDYVASDSRILVLKVLFMLMIFIYIIFITVRKLEVCLKAHKIRRFV